MKKKKVLQNILILVITVMLFLVIFEIMLRTFVKKPCFTFPQYLFMQDEENDYIMSPNRTGTVTLPEFSFTMKINSMGLRDYERDIKHYDIIAIGDSIQFGYGVELEKTYTKLLEKKLNKTVLNVAVPGYGTEQEINLFNRLNVTSDEVFLSFYIKNDFNENIDYEIKKGYLVEKGLSQVRITLNRLHSYCFIKNRIVNLMKTPKFTIEPPYKETVNLEGNYTIVLIPYKKQGRAPPTKFPGHKVIDLYPLDETNYFEVDPHLNEKGHQVIADRLYEEFKPKELSENG